MRRLLGALTLPCLLFCAVIGSVHAILPVALALMPLAFLPGVRAAYKGVVTAVQRWWFALAAALIELLAGVRVHTYGDAQPVASDRVVLIICNHHCRVDWMFLWCLAARLGQLGSLKIALKDSLRAAPFFGWAMQAFLFVFLCRRDRDADLQRLSSTLDHCAAHGDPIAFLLFPEGTDLSPSNLEKDARYATAHGKRPYAHLLHPRTAGFEHALRTLAPRLDALLDVTISYERNPSRAASEAARPHGADPRPNEKDLLTGHWPAAVHVHVRRIPRAELPCLPTGAPPPAAPAPAAAAEWLASAWDAKHARLAAAAASPRSGPAAAEAEVRPGASLWLSYAAALGSFGVCGALFVWCVLNHARWAAACTAGGAAALAALTRFGVGLDGLELRRFPPLEAGQARSIGKAKAD